MGKTARCAQNAARTPAESAIDSDTQHSLDQLTLIMPHGMRIESAQQHTANTLCDELSHVAHAFFQARNGVRTVLRRLDQQRNRRNLICESRERVGRDELAPCNKTKGTSGNASGT